MDLEKFLDLCWVTLEPTALNGIATIGSTAHLFIGP
jgi:hypothetical protein